MRARIQYWVLMARAVLTNVTPVISRMVTVPQMRMASRDPAASSMPNQSLSRPSQVLRKLSEKPMT